MGKPIAGENQYPYTIGGIIVDGAKINNKTFVKELYIHKQRSYNVYDLIDTDGVIYQYISIVYLDQYEFPLDYYSDSITLSSIIEDNTFFVKVQDISRNIYGFITLIQSNKIKVSTGDYIFLTDDYDYNLLDVYINPVVSYASTNDTVQLSALFTPKGYTNLSGVWDIHDEEVVSDSSRIANTNVGNFHCLKPGKSIVTFTPDANKLLMSTAIIYVDEPDNTYTSWGVAVNDPRNRPVYTADEIVTITSIFLPLSYSPPRPAEVTYDTTYFEYLGTENNLDYKFRVKGESLTNSSRYLSITLTNPDDNLQGRVFVSVLNKTPSYYPNIIGERILNPGESTQFRAEPNYNNYLVGEVTWGGSPEEVATVTLDGLVTAHSVGTFQIYTTVGGKNLYTSLFVSNAIDRIYIEPTIYNMSPGDSQTFTYKTSPEGIIAEDSSWMFSAVPEVTIEGQDEPNTTGELKVISYQPSEFDPGEIAPIIYANFNSEINLIKNDGSTQMRITVSKEGTSTELTSLNWDDPIIYYAVGAEIPIYFPHMTPICVSNRNIKLSIDDTSIADFLIYDEDIFVNTMETAYLIAKSRGVVEVKATSVDDPAIFCTIKVVVF